MSSEPKLQLNLDYGELFECGLPYGDFLDKYASDGDRQRWDAMHQAITLTDDQRSLLGGFVRDMKVLVLAGAWCGDCVNQCPIFDHFCQASPCVDIRYFDRDDHTELGNVLSTCGAARVPSVLFLSEDNFVCGRFGDRTLSKYRDMVSQLTGAACATGILPSGGDPLQATVVQEWLNEFERIQLMLRTSGRLRAMHGD